MFESMTFDDLHDKIVDSSGEIRSALNKLRESCADHHYLNIAIKCVDEIEDSADQLPDAKRELDLS